MIIGLFTILIIYIIGVEVINLSVYGSRYCTNEEVEKYITEEGPFSRNIFDSSILRTDYEKLSPEEFQKRWLKLHYVSKIYLPIFSKYYIHNIGLVLRWSKGHRMISELYNNTP